MIKVLPDSRAWIATRLTLGAFPMRSPLGDAICHGYWKPAGAPKSRKTMPRTARRLGISEPGIELYLSLRNKTSPALRKAIRVVLGCPVAAPDDRAWRGFMWAIDSLGPRGGLPVQHHVIVPDGASDGDSMRAHFAAAAAHGASADSLRALAPMPSGLRAVPVALLKCHICGGPAACLGEYEGHGGERPACDECCGHGNEDGHCEPLGVALAALLEVK